MLVGECPDQLEALQKRIFKIQQRMRMRRRQIDKCRTRIAEIRQQLHVLTLERHIGRRVQLRSRYRPSDPLFPLQDTPGTLLEVKDDRCVVDWDGQQWRVLTKEIRPLRLEPVEIDESSFARE